MNTAPEPAVTVTKSDLLQMRMGIANFMTATVKRGGLSLHDVKKKIDTLIKECQ